MLQILTSTRRIIPFRGVLSGSKRAFGIECDHTCATADEVARAFTALRNACRSGSV
jgi:hypothetical protein